MLVAGHDDAVAQWVGNALGVSFVAPYVALAVADANGAIRGGVVMNDYYPGGNIEITYSGVGSIQLYMLRDLARYCFIQLAASRVTAKTRRSNKLVARLLVKAGFTFEVTQKRYFGPAKADDALVYVLHRADATKWLRSE